MRLTKIDFCYFNEKKKSFLVIPPKSPKIILPEIRNFHHILISITRVYKLDNVYNF